MTEILLMLLQWATGTEYIPTAKLEESQRQVRILTPDARKTGRP